MAREFYPHGTTNSITADHRNGINRTDLFATRTRGVDENDYQAIMAGFEHIIGETRRSIHITDFGNYYLDTGPFGTPDWYQNEALLDNDTGMGRQASAGILHRLLREEPFQKKNPHFDLMVIDRDLCVPDPKPSDNFIFGYGPFPNNIISTRRFREYIKDPRLRHLSLAILGAHEFGHNLGLLYRNFNMGTQGLSACHCMGEAGDCLMEQVNIGEKTITDQARILPDRTQWLCEDCTDHIQAIREHLKGIGIQW